MYCVHCGAKIEDDSHFCTFCGQRVSLQNAVPSGVEFDNRYIWALATVPLFVSWIIAELWGDHTWVTGIVVLLNIVFIELDVNALKRIGKDAGSWLWLGIVLVPLYLFIRASKTDKNYAYGFVWCGMFLLDLML